MWGCRSVRHVEPMAFPILAFVFGLRFSALASALVSLPLAGVASGLWWLALLPLALCHGVAGFIATASAAGPRLEQPRSLRLCALVSAATTLLTLSIAIAAAVAVPLDLSHGTAEAVVVVALVAGFAGLASALRLAQSGRARLPTAPPSEK